MTAWPEKGRFFGELIAVLYSGGTVIDLSSLGGFAVNRLGDVAGYSSAAQSSNDQAVLFSGGTVKNLGSLGGQESIAYDINDSGQVVGRSDLQNSLAAHAFLYSNGSMKDLGGQGGARSNAAAINNAGQIVGIASLAGIIGTSNPNLRDQSTRHAFLYANGRMTDLGVRPGGFGSDGLGINDLGQVVGFCYEDPYTRASYIQTAS
jgi:probable HAF family extracellular repeat protein